MPQTTYNTAPARGFAGLVDRNRPEGLATGLNEESAAVPYGVAIKRGSAERSFANLTSVTETIEGVVSHKHRDPYVSGSVGAPPDDISPVAFEADVWVRCEEAISLGDRVFARAVVSGSEVAGAFRNDADGDANVWTVTPSAANATEYRLNVLIDGQRFDFTFTSDGDATAEEICDGFRTAMQANSAFDALVTSSGTTTLVLTSNDSSKSMHVDAFGSTGTFTSITETTPGAPDCIELPQCRWISASQTGADDETVALLRVNLPY